MMYRIWFWLILILLVATMLRVVALDNVPPGLYHDEAFSGLDALGILQGAGFPIFFEGNGGREPLFIYAHALSLAWFGMTPWALRIPAAFAGVLTVAVCFALVRVLTGGKYANLVALVAAAGLATSYWHLNFSRVGWRTILLPLFACLAFYWFWRAYRSGTRRDHILAGVLLGASLYTYLSARFLPIVIVLFWLSDWLVSRLPTFSTPVWHSPSRWSGKIILVLAALGVFAPLGFYFVTHPNAFFFRVSDVVLNIEANALLANTWRVVQMFFARGDAEWRHGIAYRPVLDWYTGIPFAIGLASGLWKWREPAKRFVLIWLLLLLAPTILSQDAPDTQRAIGALPALFVLVAWGWQSIAVRWASQMLLVLGTLVTLIGSGMLSGRDYFTVWANHPRAYYDFQGDLVELARWISTREENILLPFEAYAHPTIQFLIRSRYVEQHFPFSGHSLNKAELSPSTLIVPTTLSKGSYVLLRKDQAFWLHPLTTFSHPDITSVLRDRFGKPIGSFWQIDELELDAALHNSFAPLERLSDSILFDRRIELVATYFPRQITVGRPLGLGLIWLSHAPIQSNVQMFAHILDLSGRPVGGIDAALFFEYPLALLPSNFYLPARYDLRVDDTLPPGKYVIEIGLFHLARNSRLPLEINGVRVEDDRVIIQPLKVGLRATPPASLRTLNIKFGDAITLLGFDGITKVGRGEDLRLTLLWRCEKSLQRDYTLFVHIIDDANQIIAQTDIQPLGGAYPTSIWDVGELVLDEIRVAIPIHAPRGSWRIAIGWYDVQDGSRLPLADGDMFILSEVELD